MLALAPVWEFGSLRIANQVVAATRLSDAVVALRAGTPPDALFHDEGNRYRALQRLRVRRAGRRADGGGRSGCRASMTPYLVAAEDAGVARRPVDPKGRSMETVTHL